MVTKEELMEHYKEHYQNEKRGKNLNINKKLWKEYHKFCIDKDESVSARIRLLMIKDMLEN